MFSTDPAHLLFSRYWFAIIIQIKPITITAVILIIIILAVIIRSIKRSLSPCSLYASSILVFVTSAFISAILTLSLSNMIRRILPKKTSFDFLTQEKVDLMMNHINSYTRKKLNDRSAHQLFSFLYGSDVAEKLHSHPIHAAEINLTPELLK